MRTQLPRKLPFGPIVQSADNANDACQMATASAADQHGAVSSLLSRRYPAHLRLEGDSSLAG